MSTPETKNILTMARVTEGLWQKALTGDLRPDDSVFKPRLRAIDKLTQRLYEQTFAHTYKERSSFVDDTITVNTGNYPYHIGYNNDEANVGLRFLETSWAGGSWALRVEIYHFAGYHRLHQVTIGHESQQVTFCYPERFVGKHVPANTLPTDIIVKKLVSA